MAATDPTPRMPTARVSNETISLQLQQFFDDWNIRIMGSALAKTWTARKVQASALEVLALNGVDLTPEDIEELSKLEEADLLAELVPKLPFQLRQSFDALALQLQMMITAAIRVRRACDEGGDAGIQESIEETDSTSMGQQILKASVVQASKEVASLHKSQHTWSKSMEKRLDRLTRSAEFAEHAQQQLIATEAQLDRFASEQNQKSKKALMGLADSNDKSLLHSGFASWLGITMANSNERKVRNKFEKEIQENEKALFEYKERQLKGVKGVLMRGARDTDQGLMTFCVQTWGSWVAEAKRSGTTKEALMKIEAQLQQFSDRQSNNTKKVLARMSADQDATVFGLAWSAWLMFSQEYKKDKIFEDQVKKAEQSLKAHMDSKKEGAKQVLDRFNGASNSGLLSQCIQGWMTLVHEAAKAREMENAMDSAGARFASLKAGHKQNAMSVQGRVNEQIKENHILRCFTEWLLQTKVNKLDKIYAGKLVHKRQQLASVQTLFKSFARQLEEGLGNIEGETSARSTTRRTKGMSKDGGAVSLPNIHARQGIAA
jgi:hypothetical protein